MLYNKENKKFKEFLIIFSLIEIIYCLPMLPLSFPAPDGIIISISLLTKHCSLILTLLSSPFYPHQFSGRM